jgi:hypothetical protein
MLTRSTCTGAATSSLERGSGEPAVIGARCWKRNYDSVQEVVDELSEAGIATAEDARELQTRLMTEESCPLFHSAVEVRDLEDWGFTLVGSERVN